VNATFFRTTEKLFTHRSCSGLARILQTTIGFQAGSQKGADRLQRDKIEKLESLPEDKALPATACKAIRQQLLSERSPVSQTIKTNMKMRFAHGYLENKSVLLCLNIWLAASLAAAESDWLSREPLDHASYDRWSQIDNVKLSNDGLWVNYAVDPAAEGTPTKGFVQNLEDGRKYEVTRPGNGQFTSDSQHYVCRSLPTSSSDGTADAGSKGSGDDASWLEVLHLDSGKVSRYPQVKSFAIPEQNGDWVACQLQDSPSPSRIGRLESVEMESYVVATHGLENVKPTVALKSRADSPAPDEDTTAIDSDSNRCVEDPVVHKKTTGTPLLLHSLKTHDARIFSNVIEFNFTIDGRYIAFIKSSEPNYSFKPTPKDELKTSEAVSANRSNEAVDRDGVFVLDLVTNQLECLVSDVGQYKHIQWCRDSRRLAFLSTHETEDTKNPEFSIYCWQAESLRTIRIPKVSDSMTGRWSVSPESRPYFSEDGRRLFFHNALALSIHATDETSAPASKPMAVLDVWNWKDPRLQSEQLLRLKKDGHRTYLAAYHLVEDKTTQLETPELPEVAIDEHSTSPWAIANCDIPYLQEESWESPGFQDIYLVSLETGERRLLVKACRGTGRLSPCGRYATWFDPQQHQWVCISTDANSKAIVISSEIPYPLYDELHDEPSLPSDYGTAGWLEDDQAFLVYDRFDVWMLDPTAKQRPVCLTKGMGRDKGIILRCLKLSKRASAVMTSDVLLLSAFSIANKQSGFYRLDWDSDDLSDSTLLAAENSAASDLSKRKVDKTLNQIASESILRPGVFLEESLTRLVTSADSKRVVFCRETFRRFPDLWSSTTSFERIDRISDANPQQSAYRWGQAKLVQWKATDGQPLEGILYTPEEFNNSRHHPMIVYFYERRSDQLHKYHSPAPARTSINISFYVSRGYVVFVPDVVYRGGMPGQSAINCVLSGVKHIVDQGFIDEKKIGIQGHSWGGYQTAFLISQSDMFACAEAGAPVSNMTSAYGGIRLESGRSRMSQYERKQSRIGESLWKARDKFIDNSPLFFANQIKTPLLILHNDLDDAVPWQQGVELFSALRRLRKPVWLLNYNGEPHAIKRDQNRRDFAIRMQQFFDFHLQDAPEPEWMALGVPAEFKGKRSGLDLMAPLPEASVEQTMDK
jgi:dienelactone hydrolase